MEGDRYRALGAWLITDISIYKGVCLDALAIVSDLVAGRPPFEEWSSEFYEVEFGPWGLRFRSLWMSGQDGEYAVPEAKEAVIEQVGVVVA